MRLISKAVLGALAIASVASATTPAFADHVVVQLGTPGVVVEPRNPCMRAPEFRPAFCFRHDWGWHNGWRNFAFNDRDRWMRDQMWRDRERERERQAFLEHRYYDMR